MNTYYAASEHAIKWQLLNASTLLGAKREASRIFQVCRDGKIEIAVKKLASYEVVAVKYGYGKWATF